MSEDEIQSSSEQVATELRRMEWREEKRERKIRRHEIPCGLLLDDEDEDDLNLLREKIRRKRPYVDQPQRNGPVTVVYSREEAARGVLPPADIEAKYGKNGTHLPHRNPPWRAKIEPDRKAGTKMLAFSL